MDHSRKSLFASRAFLIIAASIIMGAEALHAEDAPRVLLGDGMSFEATQSVATSPATFGINSSKVDSMLQRLLAERAAGERIKAWVLFTDKGLKSARARDSALADVLATYNRRALERRRLRRTLPGLVDWNDVPVHQRYVEAVGATGAEVHIVSRWLNGVSAWVTVEQVMDLGRLPFVRAVHAVRRARRIEADNVSATQVTYEGASERDSAAQRRTLEYGVAEAQLTQVNLIALHDLGYTGEGVIIGMLDSGFEVDHLAFNDPEKAVTIVAEWDFVNDDPDTGYEPGDLASQHAHGTQTLSIIGAYRPGEMIGGAFDASFIVAKTEDDRSEYPAEEDNYVGGLEFIEANGGDIATSSLGYVAWYTADDYDGRTTVTAVATNIATANGVHCIKSAGNGGNDGDPTTHHLDTPADAFKVIACGSVDEFGNTSFSSSDGPTVDGRVKPELLARGVNTQCVNAYDPTAYTGASGTSFSAPIVASAVACLLQAHPDWTIDQMRSYLFRTADYYTQSSRADPVYVRGYGIVNAVAALTPDCNENTVNDATDIALGTSPDCNNNGLPDECDLDLAGDYQETDCNDNGVVDMCDTGPDASSDCDYNSIPDECQPDCDGDSTPDACAIWPMGASPDTNDNDVPDECDVVSATSPASPHDAHKNRYISFQPNNYDINVAFQVELTEGPGSAGVLGWVGQTDENGVARVVDEPYYGADWPEAVFVGDCEVVPVATYAIRATVEGVQLTDPLEVATIHQPVGRYYGDVVGVGTGDLPPLPGYTPPNGNVNVSDVQAYILTAQGDSSPSVHTTWVDMHGQGEGSPPNFILNVSDLQRILFGFEGLAYTDTPQQIVPADCP